MIMVYVVNDKSIKIYVDQWVNVYNLLGEYWFSGKVVSFKVVSGGIILAHVIDAECAIDRWVNVNHVL